MAREIPIEEESQVAGGVVLLGDLLFTGSRSGKFVHANAATGEIIWTNSDCEGEAHTTPAVDEEHVVFGANDGMLYTLERKTGKLLWKKELDDTPASAVIARDKVIVTADGKLYLLRLSDGGIIATYPVSDELTSPCIAGNLVVVGGDDGLVTAFSGKSGA
jgi:outer membrane protein assembly factor BamB